MNSIYMKQILCIPDLLWPCPANQQKNPCAWKSTQKVFMSTTLIHVCTVALSQVRENKWGLLWKPHVVVAFLKWGTDWFPDLSWDRLRQIWYFWKFACSRAAVAPNVCGIVDCKPGHKYDWNPKKPLCKGNSLILRNFPCCKLLHQISNLQC